jgi:hypothetical protein
MRHTAALAMTMVALAGAACSEPSSAPARLDPRAGGPILELVQQPPPFSFTAVLIGPGGASGLIRFRQPEDAVQIVFLDTQVQKLAPGTSYLLQRAVDPTPDGQCTSAVWLTLGNLAAPLAITTNGEGTGRATFSRLLTSAPGTQFDIHFQVVDAVTGAVVLTSSCHQFMVR